MKRFTIAIITIYILCLYLGGCCACRKGSPIIGNLEQTTWKFIEVYERKVDSISCNITFDPSSKVLKGNSNIGEIWSGYHLYDNSNNNIVFTNPGSNSNSTTMNDIVKLLEQTKMVKIDNGYLLMIDEQSNIIAILAEK